MEPESGAKASDQTIAEPAPGTARAVDSAAATRQSGSAPAPSAPAFPAGTKIGPYEIMKTLGRGAMGIVLAAKHTDLGREVALKVLAGGLAAEPESVERFHRESEAVARLDHPGIVRLFERGESNGTHYYAMELVKGTSLDNVIRRERVAYVEAARIVAQCAHAIDFAHGMGVLHRDLKPANILLETSGRARITDFGLARMDRKATLTSEGTVVGTPLYLAPEVATGDRATRKSDIYSLGATLYELATGKPPYEGRDARTVMMRVLNDQPIPPTDADPRIPRDLVRIIGKAMARKPDDRYANARSLALDLERFAQGRSLEIAGASPAFRESTASRYWKRVVVQGGTVAAIAIIVGVIMWLNVKRRHAEQEAKKLETELKHVRETGTNPDGSDPKVDAEGVHAAQDRDVRARIALRALSSDAQDANAKRSFDDLLARARPSERDEPGVASTLLHQALQIFPHRWDIHVELARTIAGTEPDDAENELTMCLVSSEPSKDVALAAHLERARLYRMKGDAIALWLAASDLKVAIQSGLRDSERMAATADLAFALATLGEVKAAQSLAEQLGGLAGDELARASLARVAIARAKNDAATADVELAKARDAAQSDDVKRLVDAASR